MDVGAELRHAREQRGLSLHQMAQRTKISLQALHAIETNDLARLPGGVFTRGFVRAYAGEVGLDPAEMTERYTAQFQPPPSTPVDAQAQPALPAAHHESPWHLRIPWNVVTEHRGTSGGFIVIAGIAFAYVVFAWWGGALRDAGARLPPDTAVVAAGDARQPGVVGTRAARATGTSSEARAVPVGTAGQVLRVELQSRDACWVSATVDGKRVVYRLLTAGEKQAIEVNDVLILRVGEPANLGLSINGSPGRLTAPPGMPATVRITRQNFAEFLVR